MCDCEGCDSIKGIKQFYIDSSTVTLLILRWKNCGCSLFRSGSSFSVFKLPKINQYLWRPVILSFLSTLVCVQFGPLHFQLEFYKQRSHTAAPLRSGDQELRGIFLQTLVISDTIYKDFVPLLEYSKRLSRSAACHQCLVLNSCLFRCCLTMMVFTSFVGPFACCNTY